MREARPCEKTRKRKGLYKTGERAGNEGQTRARDLGRGRPSGGPSGGQPRPGAQGQTYILLSKYCFEAEVSRSRLAGGWGETFFALSQTSAGAAVSGGLVQTCRHAAGPPLSSSGSRDPRRGAVPKISSARSLSPCAPGLPCPASPGSDRLSGAQRLRCATPQPAPRPTHSHSRAKQDVRLAERRTPTGTDFWALRAQGTLSLLL